MSAAPHWLMLNREFADFNRKCVLSGLAGRKSGLSAFWASSNGTTIEAIRKTEENQ
jgi:hypothetical protein